MADWVVAAGAAALGVLAVEVYGTGMAVRETGHWPWKNPNQASSCSLFVASVVLRALGLSLLVSGAWAVKMICDADMGFVLGLGGDITLKWAIQEKIRR